MEKADKKIRSRRRRIDKLIDALAALDNWFTAPRVLPLCSFESSFGPCRGIYFLSTPHVLFSSDGPVFTSRDPIDRRTGKRESE